MSDQNPFANAFSAPVASPEEGGTPASPAPSNPFASAFSSGASTTTPANPFASAFGSSPDNGPTEHAYQDSSQPWYKRAWDWSNTPLTESLFGLPAESQGRSEERRV